MTKGQQVEVTIRIEEPAPPRYPLRGLPFRYDEPFAPAVDEDDWEASKRSWWTYSTPLIGTMRRLAAGMRWLDVWHFRMRPAEL